MDPALWITWYDLPAARRAEHDSWLHERYIPRVLERPGVLWAAHYAAEPVQVRTDRKDARRYPAPGTVPGGHDYIVIFGAEHAHAFANPAPRHFHADLATTDRAVHGLRTGEMSNVMIEQTRIAGGEPRSEPSSVALSPCIQLGSFVYGGDEDELLAWYAQWRLPSMTGLSGCVAVRKLVSVSGWAKHAILHEFVSVAAREAHFVNHEKKRYPEKAPWSERITGEVIHAPGSPNVAQRVFSAVKPGR
jgi:hypothetical protein